MNDQEQYPTMGEREKYLFDLQGFLLIRGFLSIDEVKVLNDSLEPTWTNVENTASRMSSVGNGRGGPSKVGSVHFGITAAC